MVCESSSTREPTVRKANFSPAARSSARAAKKARMACSACAAGGRNEASAAAAASPREASRAWKLPSASFAVRSEAARNPASPARAVERSARRGSMSRIAFASRTRAAAAFSAAVNASRDFRCRPFSNSQAADLPAMPSLMAGSAAATSGRSEARSSSRRMRARTGPRSMVPAPGTSDDVYSAASKSQRVSSSRNSRSRARTSASFLKSIASVREKRKASAPSSTIAIAKPRSAPWAALLFVMV